MRIWLCVAGTARRARRSRTEVARLLAGHPHLLHGHGSASPHKQVSGPLRLLARAPFQHDQRKYSRGQGNGAGDLLQRLGQLRLRGFDPRRQHDTRTEDLIGWPGPLRQRAALIRSRRRPAGSARVPPGTPSIPERGSSPSSPSWFSCGDGSSLAPGYRLTGPGSRWLGGEVRIRLGEVQNDLCLSIVSDLRHERSDLLRDRLPSPRSYPRCLCLRVCPSCHRHDHPGTILRPAAPRAGRAGGGPGTRRARDKWPAPRSRRVTRPCCPPRDGRLPAQGPTPALGRLSPAGARCLTRSPWRPSSDGSLGRGWIRV